MAAPEPEAKPEAGSPSPSREPPPGSEPGAPAAAAGSQELQPWEQHAAVINLPRYDYRASGSLLLRSHSGFLITCPISASPLLLLSFISALNLPVMDFLVDSCHLRSFHMLNAFTLDVIFIFLQSVKKVLPRKPFPFLKR